MRLCRGPSGRSAPWRRGRAWSIRSVRWGWCSLSRCSFWFEPPRAESPRGELVDDLALRVFLGPVMRVEAFLAQALERLAALRRALTCGRCHRYLSVACRQHPLGGPAFVFETENPKAIPLQFGGGPHAAD